MNLKNKISDSAYLVNVSRAKALQISNDIFADLWIPSDQKKDIYKLWDNYSKFVYPYDDIELGIRTNYFLQSIKSQLNEHPNTILINLGSGLTSYQYLLQQEITTIEVDVHDIIEIKQNRAKKLIKERILPQRETIYFTCDFNNTEERIKLFKKLKKTLGKDSKTFILMEGLLYYLSTNTTQKLLYNNQIIQLEDSISAFDYWKPTVVKSQYYNGMMEFYENQMAMDSSSINFFYAKQLIDNNCYIIMEDTDVFIQEKLLLDAHILNENKKISLEESYFKMKKKVCIQQGRSRTGVFL